MCCRIKDRGIWPSNSGSPASTDRSQNILRRFRPLLCILGRLEGGKKKARVGRWEGEREEPRPRGSRIFRLFYDRPPYDCYFSSFATFGTGVPSGSLFGGERIRAVKMMSFLRKFRWKFSDRWYWYFFRTESRNGGLSLSRSEQLSSTPVCIGKQIYKTL